MAPAREAPTREETLAVVRRSIRCERLLTEDGRLIKDYVDGHALLGDPTGLAGCCELVCERLRELRPAAVAGEVSAACGLVSSVVLRCRQEGIALQGRYVRKAEKGYGVTGLLNTELEAAGPVVLLDDVTGKGDAAVRVVQALRGQGHEVTAMVVVVDRGEGAAERLDELGVELSWLFDLREARCEVALDAPPAGEASVGAETRVGVQLHPVHVTAAQLREAWCAAEELGVDSVWVWDHFLPTYGPPGGPSFECWSLLAAMAATTERVQIGSMVSPIGYRKPALLAHLAHTVAALADGRLVLGVGAGWLRRDFVRHGYDFPPIGERLDQLEEGIATVKGELAKRDVEVPLMIGGGGTRRTLPLAAREARIWNGFGDPDWFAERSRRLDECCAEIGRDPAEIERCALTDARRGSRDWAAYREAGAQRIVIGLGHPWDWGLVEDALASAPGSQVK